MPTRVQFLKQLNELESLLTRFDEKCASDVRAAGLAATGDAGAVTGLLAGQKAADRLRQEIESMCLDIMLLQQPLIGDDLRLVTASYRVVSDLAKIDSITRSIAFIFSETSRKAASRLADGFVRMSEHAAAMVENSMAAFLAKDEKLARAVIESDDELDQMYAAAVEVVVELIKNGKPSPKSLPELLMVAKHFEHVGDTAQRVADWAVFRATGERILTQGDHSADDETLPE